MKCWQPEGKGEPGALGVDGCDVPERMGFWANGVERALAKQKWATVWERLASGHRFWSRSAVVSTARCRRHQLQPALAHTLQSEMRSVETSEQVWARQIAARAILYAYHHKGCERKNAVRSQRTETAPERRYAFANADHSNRRPLCTGCRSDCSMYRGEYIIATRGFIAYLLKRQATVNSQRRFPPHYFPHLSSESTRYAVHHVCSLRCAWTAAPSSFLQVHAQACVRASACPCGLCSCAWYALLPLAKLVLPFL
jgi:hypothetical protein